MDELIAFMNARLDEDEAAALALSGTEWTARRLGDHDYEIWVTPHQLVHTVAPTAGIADAQREDVAEWIASNDPRRALREVAAKRAILARYESETQPSVYAPEPEVQELIDQRTQVLEDVLHDLAAVWSDHADYDPAWGR